MIRRQRYRKLWRLMHGPAPMGLLLQGDVATGKTAVAVCAALAAIAAGLQVAFLAPTELLAEQHCAAVRSMLGIDEIEIDLLTATSIDRADVEAKLESGRPGFVFGTHALFSKSTEFGRLGLVIIDEQHRFRCGPAGEPRAQGRESPCSLHDGDADSADADPDSVR